MAVYSKGNRECKNVQDNGRERVRERERERASERERERREGGGVDEERPVKHLFGLIVLVVRTPSIHLQQLHYITTGIFEIQIQLIFFCIHRVAAQKKKPNCTNLNCT